MQNDLMILGASVVLNFVAGFLQLLVLLYVKSVTSYIQEIKDWIRSVDTQLQGVKTSYVEKKDCDTFRTPLQETINKSLHNEVASLRERIKVLEVRFSNSNERKQKDD